MRGAGRGGRGATRRALYTTAGLFRHIQCGFVGPLSAVPLHLPDTAATIALPRAGGAVTENPCTL